jgi:hypothetical protein
MRRALAVLACAACLDPLVDDVVVARDLILPAGAALPAIADDPALARQIDEHDGVGAHVPLFDAFAAGRAARYRDLGPAPSFAAPIFVLLRRNEAGELVASEHPPIVDAIPGDPGYSPFRILFAVELTPRHAGEVFPSLAALQQGIDEGLALSPMRQPVNLNAPVVAAGVTVETRGEVFPVARGAFHYRGRRGEHLDLGRTALPNAAAVPTVDLYVLRREGGEPLREPSRNVDMTGDGDLDDTNDVLALPGDDPGFSPRCREVLVTVAASTRSIDGTGDGGAEIIAADQLFLDGRPRSPPVVAATPTGRTFNCPVAAGAP